MPDPTTLQAEIDALHAKLIAAEASFVLLEDGDPSIDSDSRLIVGRRNAIKHALLDAWPTLSAELTKLRRQAAAFDAISSSINAMFDPSRPHDPFSLQIIRTWTWHSDPVEYDAIDAAQKAKMEEEKE